MTLLDSIVSSVAPDLNAQVEAAKTEAQQIAQVVAAWGFIVVVELALLIYVVARKRGL